jgi:peptide/nickel transport system permease protein
VTILAVSILIFLAMQILPGDAAQAILGRNASAAALSDIRMRLGLDQPLLTRYLTWIGGVLQGDLGRSAAGSLAGQPGGSVWALMAGRLSNSLVLAGTALVVIASTGILLGITSALRHGRRFDRIVSSITVALIALPEFVTGALLVLCFAVVLRLLPAVSIVAPGQNPLATPSVLILPVLTLAAASIAQLIRMVRAGMLDVLGAPFVEMAALNGIGRSRIIWRYAFRNTLAPTVQVLAQTAQWLLGGIIVTETVFNYPGIGFALVQAVALRDFPFVESVSLIIATIYIALNIAADLAVTLVVPKLRTELTA